MLPRLHIHSFLEVDVSTRCTPMVDGVDGSTRNVGPLPTHGRLRLVRSWEGGRFVCSRQVKGTKQAIGQATLDSVLARFPEAQQWDTGGSCVQPIESMCAHSPQSGNECKLLHKFIQQVSPQEATQLAHKHSLTEMLAVMAWSVDDVMGYVSNSNGMLKVKSLDNACRQGKMVNPTHGQGQVVSPTHGRCLVFKYTDKKNKHDTWSALEARLRGAIYVNHRWLEPTPKCFHADQLNLDRYNQGMVRASVKEDGTSILVFRAEGGLTLTTLGGEEGRQVDLIKQDAPLLSCLETFMNQFEDYCLVQFELLHQLDGKHQYIPNRCLRAFHASNGTLEQHGAVDLSGATSPNVSLVSVIKPFTRPLAFMRVMADLLPPPWDPCSWTLLREGYMAQVSTGSDTVVVKVKSRIWVLCCKGPQVTTRGVTTHIANEDAGAKQAYLDSFGQHLVKNKHALGSPMYLAAMNIQSQRYDHLADQIWASADQTAERVRACVGRILPGKVFDATIDVNKWSGTRRFLQFDGTLYLNLTCVIGLAKKYPALDWPAREFVGRTLKLKHSPPSCSTFVIPST